MSRYLRRNTSEYNTIINDTQFLLLSLIFYSIFIFKYYKNKNYKIINEFVHLFHTLTTIYLIMNESYNYTILLNLAFYFVDTIKLVIFDNFKKLNFIFHHILTLYTLYNIYYDSNNIRLHTIEILYILEYSNIMLYINNIVYNITKNKYIITFMSIKQFLWYSICRIIFFGNIIYNKYNTIIEQNLSIKIIIGCIYLIGVIWSILLFKRMYNYIYKNYKFKNIYNINYKLE